ncbi:proline-rich protein 2-like [Heliangelus exortis]|uniref:proline-rich protein 2-like n=1 Tax=Heliangelus exortis TaxID=472823 RepID=UPI003A90D780
MAPESLRCCKFQTAATAIRSCSQGHTDPAARGKKNNKKLAVPRDPTPGRCLTPGTGGTAVGPGKTQTRPGEPPGWSLLLARAGKGPNKGSSPGSSAAGSVRERLHRCVPPPYNTEQPSHPLRGWDTRTGRGERSPGWGHPAALPAERPLPTGAPAEPSPPGPAALRPREVYRRFTRQLPGTGPDLLPHLRPRTELNLSRPQPRRQNPQAEPAGTRRGGAERSGRPGQRLPRWQRRRQRAGWCRESPALT